MTERVDAVSENIDFAMEQNRELSQLIAQAQRDDTKVRFIAQKSGSILSSLRECYDYAIADIRDQFLPKEKRNVYFPFHPETLTAGKPLHALTSAAPALYEYLHDLAASMKTKKIIPGTVCLYGDARAINDLVNAKKHKRLLQISEAPNAKTRIETSDGLVATVTPIFPIKDDGTVDWSKPHGGVGPQAWTGSPGTNITAVKDFHFDPGKIHMSRVDVHGFCMTAITATRFIMGDVFYAAFSVPIDRFREN